MADSMSSNRRFIRICAAAAAIAGFGLPLFADPGDGIVLGASGVASIFADLSYPARPDGGLGNPGPMAGLESDLRLSAEGPTTLFRLRLGAYAQGDRSSGIDPMDYSDALELEVREAEAALVPTPTLAVRGGILLRNFGIAVFGSPIDPFARAEGMSGYWGLDAEWTPTQDLSVLALLSADRIARTGKLSGFSGLDSGALVRYSPGILDAAAGLYASGAGEGELRPIGYLSLPLLSILTSLEAALSLPLGGAIDRPSASLRAELRKSMGIGQTSLDLGVAYRGIFPGRNESEIAELLATSTPDELSNLPFAPYYGRQYAELSVYLENAKAFSLAVDLDFALPWGSLTAAARAEVYIGDAGLFLQVQGVAGDTQGEFNTMAMAAGMPGLELRTGVEISF